MRILGIDLGSSSIKAVELESAFGRYDIHDYHERPIESGSNPEENVSQLLKSLPKTPDRIVVAMQTGQTTFRNLTLPTRDKKAIQSGVGFELEDELPFSVEDSIYDYVILSQTKQGSNVHVSASLKRHLISYLEKCSNAHLAPDVITTEAWAYRTLMNRLLPPATTTAPVLLIQIGHAKTLFYLHWQGAPAFTREISWGGKDLTAAICLHFGIPIEQAEAAKLDHGFISTSKPSTEITSEQLEYSKCLEPALQLLASELKQVELMCKNVTRQNISMIYLAGGTTLLPGLVPWIEERIKTQVKPLLGLSSITTSGVTYSEQTDARFVLAASLALSQVGADRALCINFRKKEFAKEVRTRKIDFNALKKPMLAVGIVAVSLFLSLTIQSSVYKSQMKTVDAQLEKSVRSFFGQVSSSGLRTYMSNPSLLRSSINKELNKQRELNRLFGPNSHSPIDFLSSLSAGIPKDVIVDLVQFQSGIPSADSFIGGDQNSSATLSFWVSNPQIAERLATFVGNKIVNMQRGKMEEIATAAADGGEKKWKITFSGKPSEDSYGK